MLDMKHPNHEHTDEIMSVFGGNEAVKNIIRNCHERKLQNLVKGKGGRPPSEAMEFVLTLPKGIRPEKEQWRKMINDVMGDVAKKMGVSGDDFKGIVRGVVHRQSQDKAIKGSGDHMHLMIGKFTNDNKHLPDLQRKGVLHVMKESFNKQMREVMGIDNRTYEPSKGYNGIAKKKAPQWKVKAARKNEALVAKEQELELRESDVSVLQASSVQSLSKLLAYLDKFEEAQEAKDVRQMARQKNRINKEMEKRLPTQMALEAQGFEETEELKRAKEAYNKRVELTNTKTKSQLPKLETKPSI